MKIHSTVLLLLFCTSSFAQPVITIGSLLKEMTDPETPVRLSEFEWLF